MSEQTIKFLADESCDFSIVRTLRSIGYDVVAVVESFPSSPDIQVLKCAVDEARILLMNLLRSGLLEDMKGVNRCR